MKLFKNLYIILAAFLLSIAVIIFLLDLNQDLFFVLNKSLNFLGNAFWSHITLFGDTLFALVLLLAFSVKYPRKSFHFLFLGLILALTVQAMKSGFSIERPPAILDASQFFLIGPKHNLRSFPSGHTATAFFLFGFFSTLVKDFRYKALFFLFACIVGVSRVSVGVHWPLDVLVGGALGWSICYFHESNSMKRLQAKRSFNYILFLGLIVYLLFYESRLSHTLLFQLAICTLAVFYFIYKIINLLVDQKVFDSGKIPEDLRNPF